MLFVTYYATYRLLVTVRLQMHLDDTNCIQAADCI